MGWSLNLHNKGKMQRESKRSTTIFVSASWLWVYSSDQSLQIPAAMCHAIMLKTQCSNIYWTPSCWECFHANNNSQMSFRINWSFPQVLALPTFIWGQPHLSSLGCIYSHEKHRSYTLKLIRKIKYMRSVKC